MDPQKQTPINAQYIQTYFFSQFLIFRLKVLTVSAPWGIEFNKNIPIWIIDNLIKVLSYHNLHDIMNTAHNFKSTY